MNNSFGKEIIPDNERERLAALHHYGAVESQPSAALDRIANLAAKYFRTPIALVSLVDSEYVHFTANVGMTGNDKVDRGISLCSLAVLDNKPTVFTDALEEPCLLSNPLVTGDFGLRFYAGAPLVSMSGHNIGSICIVDKEKRDFSSEDESMLEQLSQMVMHELNIRQVAALKAASDLSTIRAGEINLQESGEQLDQTKEALRQYHFISSHNLQEPLRKLMLFTSKLHDFHIHDDDAAGRKIATKVVEAARQVSKMIADLDQVAELYHEPGEPGIVELGAVAAEAHAKLRGELDAAGVAVAIGLLPSIQGDYRQISLLLQKLFENALHFVELGKPMQVSIGWNRENTGCHEIYFADNGLVPDGANTDRSFGLFAGENRIAGSQPSAALALCRKIIQNHGGGIRHDSEDGFRRRLIITFP